MLDVVLKRALDSIVMTKAELVAIFGTAAAVARFYGITDAAVSAWSDDQPIPELREVQLRLRRPDIFCEAPTKTEAA